MSATTLVTAKSHGLKCVRNRCFTISLPPFLSGPAQTGGLARLPSLSWSKTFQVSGQVRERTGPALIHNQLVDRSLQTNVCDETVCYECQELLPVPHPVPFLVTGSRFSSGFLPAKSATGRHSCRL